MIQSAEKKKGGENRQREGAREGEVTSANTNIPRSVQTYSDDGERVGEGGGYPVEKTIYTLQNMAELRLIWISVGFLNCLTYLPQ